MKLLSHPEFQSVQSDHDSNENAQNFANFRPGTSGTGTFRLRCLGFKRLKLKFIKYPAIHTNYIISHGTTLQYNYNI